MLNISHHKLHKKVPVGGYQSFKKVLDRRMYPFFNRVLGIFALIGLAILFLPWTQNVQGKGYVTTLTPDQRPQTIQSPMAGRIEKWYVQEGDVVQKGDTILFISEVKNEYQDPKLLERTLLQRDAKNRSKDSYAEKIKVLQNQVSVLETERGLKLSQAKNKLRQTLLKVQSDSINLLASQTNLDVAQRQYDRTVTLEKEGLKSRADVEIKQLKLQETQAKRIASENKLLSSQNEVATARIELQRISASYAEKIGKTRSDQFSAESALFETEAQVSKLENQSANYEIRKQQHYIRAPQNGVINRAIRVGIGETFKEGEKLLSIMPIQYDLAIETYIDPLDLPLIHKGEYTRIQFEGWPVLFFSGWPNTSFGTFGGKIQAVETFISKNGKFRVLIVPDKSDRPWPENIRVGSGAYTTALLDDVPIWYELWRQLNSFPPNYYTPEEEENKSQKDTK